MYIEKDRRILIKKFLDNKTSRDYSEENLESDFNIDDIELDITLDVIYVKDYIYYLFSTLFQEYNYWHNTHNYRDKTS